MKYQQSEPIQERRRWIIVLVSDADATAPLTGATGQVYLSKNGATGVLSTNSLVEVDASHMPGHYYVELTASELDTLGWISLYAKTASSKAFEDRAFVSYDDPAARHGGFAIEGSGSKGGISKSQAKALLEDIRKVVQEEMGKVELPEAQDDDSVIIDMLQRVITAVEQESEAPEPVDLTPVLDAIKKLKDYSSELTQLNATLAGLKDLRTTDVEAFNKSVNAMQTKMNIASQEINNSLVEVSSVKAGFESLKQAVDDFGATIQEQSDMDKRFDAMTSSANNNKLEELTKQITKLAATIVAAKFDILKQLIK